MSSAPIAITVSMDPELPPFDRHGEPVTIGVALPRGQVSRSDGWSLTDGSGADVPVQATTLDRWGDGSVRWQLIEFHASVAARASATYALQYGGTMPAARPGLHVEHAGENLLVATGAARFSVPRSGAALLADAQVGGLSILGSSSIDAEDAAGTRYQFITRRATVERAGPLRAVLHLDGGLEDADGLRWLDAAVRLHFFAGLGTVRIELSVTNPRAASHPGGQWDLGDPGSVLLRDLSVVFSRRVASSDVSASLDRAERLVAAGSVFGLYQDSSGGERWRHANHVNRDGVVATAFQGYRAWRDAGERSGLRASPVVSSGAGDERLTVAMRHFWETFPKAVEADSERMVLGVLPRHASDAHELQGGERMSATFAVCFGPDTVSAEPLFWIRSPLHVHADPESYRRAGMCASVSRGSRASHERYDQLVGVAIGGQDSFRHRREIIDEYGWRNFGEIYADHESVGKAEPLVSHYNNQYDAIGGLATRFLQTGDHRWWTLADELAAHVTAIDLYHTHDDRAAYNGGYFWHTQHYQPAQTASHRAYSKLATGWGGGPSNEHNYTSGLMLHYFLTGSESSRAAVLQLGDWVLDMDDGAKSRFRWIDRRDTGLASGTRSMDFHGPGRGAGNSINALLDAHRLTGEPRYLEKADRLIARCVHPDDDPATIDPLDAENRWSYTVFLQTLGKYLEHRADRDLVDERFAYARAVLLRWARWMCVTERPYLDRPERLEYPTETWAAQDLRKAAVFEFAARHTQDEGDYASFLARADGFVDYVMATLAAMPTSRLARPVVLLLAYGMQRPLLSRPIAAAGVATTTVERARFTPLRQRVVRRMMWAGAGLSAAALAVIVLLIS
jgi:hypothetical protein